MIRDDLGERLEYIKSPTLLGVEMLFAYESSQPWHVFHERYAFCGCRIADAGWRYRGREYRSTDRTSMLLEPGETHCNTTIRGRSDFKVVFIPAEMLGHAARELGIRGIPHFRLANTDEPRLFEAIYRYCASSQENCTELEQQTLFAELVGTILRYGERPSSTSGIGGCRAAVERAKRHIVENYRCSISLDELARVACLSRFHLIRAFARYAGLPPHAYQIHVRIANALVLLRQGMSIMETASFTGFADQSHFTRHFRQVMKVTPGKYAHEHRRGFNL